MSQQKALVVDDVPANRDFLERLLAQAGFDVMGAHNGASAFEHVHGLDQLALAVVDMHLPDINGLHLTYKLRNRFSQTLIVIATMYDDHSLMESAFAKGGNIYMVKPHGFMDLHKQLTTVGIPKMRAMGPIVYDRHGMRPFVNEAYR